MNKQGNTEPYQALPMHTIYALQEPFKKELKKLQEPKTGTTWHGWNIGSDAAVLS